MNQGEIWLVGFAPKVGDEIDKKRPALIVSNNSIGRLRLKIVVPITDPSATVQSWHICIDPDGTNGLSKAVLQIVFRLSLSQMIAL